MKTNQWMTNKWVLWGIMNAVLVTCFGYAVMTPVSAVKASLLPGETTHGHYQIELDCNACHAPAAATDQTNKVGELMKDSCNRCHAEQLRESKDTHPAKKFNDPTNADLLLILDAQDCLTCHREHVPEQTLTMGLTMPNDYCWHCHQEIAENRPSHEGMRFDSCATAGCHNYHDNRAIYEKYLSAHYDQPDTFDVARLQIRQTRESGSSDHPDRQPLGITEADRSSADVADPQILQDWADSAHAIAGINCGGCHVDSEWASENIDRNDPQAWSDKVALETCASCHERQFESFQTGKHGMRIAAGMSPMMPALARLPMHTDAAHRSLTCSACHADHRFDTSWAAVEACLGCHADEHSNQYQSSPHAALWQQEQAGDLPAGSGVTCASCHMPRQSDGDVVWVDHDQNSNLRPNETMARQVCQQCHGLEFALSALADIGLIQSCFRGSPERRIKSVQMAHEWFEKQEQKRKQRQSKRRAKEQEAAMES